MVKHVLILLIFVSGQWSGHAHAAETRARQLDAAGKLLICKTEGSRETELINQLGKIQSARKMTQCETCDGVRLGDYQAEALRRLRMLREAQSLESLFTYEVLYGGINADAKDAQAKLISSACGGASSFARRASDFAIESRIRASSPEQLSSPGFVSDLKKFNRDLCADPAFKNSLEKIAKASLVAFQTPAGRKARADVTSGLAPMNALTDEILNTCKVERANYYKRIAGPKAYEPDFGDFSSKDNPAYLLKIEKENKTKMKQGIEFTRAALAINKSLKKMVESPYGRLLITRSFRKTLGFDSLEINAGNVMNACYSIAGKIAGGKKFGRKVFEKNDVTAAMQELRLGLAESLQDTLPYRYPKVFKPTRNKLDKQLAAEMRAQTDLNAMSGLLDDPALAKASCSAMKTTAAADAYNQRWAERIGYIQTGIGVLGGVLAPFTGGASMYASMAAGAGLTVISADLSLSQVENAALDARPLMASQLTTSVESESQEALVAKSKNAKAARDAVANENQDKEDIRDNRNLSIGMIAGGAVVARASQLIKPTMLRGAVNVTNDYVIAPVLTQTFNTGDITESAAQDLLQQELTTVISKKFGYKGGRMSVAPGRPPMVKGLDFNQKVSQSRVSPAADDWWKSDKAQPGETNLETEARIDSRERFSRLLDSKAKNKRLTKSKKEIIESAYQKHMTGKRGSRAKDDGTPGEPADLKKKRAIVEFRQELEESGFSKKEARDWVRELSANGVLGSHEMANEHFNAAKAYENFLESDRGPKDAAAFIGELEAKRTKAEAKMAEYEAAAARFKKEGNQAREMDQSVRAMEQEMLRDEIVKVINKYKEKPEISKHLADSASDVVSVKVNSESPSGVTSKKVVSLFDTDGSAIKDYQNALKSIGENSVIQFPDGKTFNVKGILGQGESTIIFDLGNGKALRIFKYADRVSDTADISSMVLGSEEINRSDIPHARLLETDGKTYAVVEKVDIDPQIGDARKFFSALNGNQPIDKKVLDEWYVFSRKTAKYSFLYDLHPEQIVYSKDRGWVLLDYLDGSRMYSGGKNSKTIFDHDQRWKIPSEIRARMERDIASERATYPKVTSPTLASNDIVLEKAKALLKPNTIITEKMRRSLLDAYGDSTLQEYGLPVGADGVRPAVQGNQTKEQLRAKKKRLESAGWKAAVEAEGRNWDRTFERMEEKGLLGLSLEPPKDGKTARASLEALAESLPKSEDKAVVITHPELHWEAMDPASRRKNIDRYKRDRAVKEGPLNPNKAFLKAAGGGSKSIDHVLTKTQGQLDLALKTINSAKKSGLLSANDELTILSRAKREADADLEMIQPYIDKNQRIVPKELASTNRLIERLDQRIKDLKSDSFWNSNEALPGETGLQTEARLTARNEVRSELDEVEQAGTLKKNKRKEIEVAALTAHETGKRAVGKKGEPGYQPPDQDKLRAIANFRKTLIQNGFTSDDAGRMTENLAGNGVLGKIEVVIPDMQKEMPAALALKKQLQSLPKEDLVENSPALKPLQDEYTELLLERDRLSVLGSDETNSAKRNAYKEQKAGIDRKLKNVEFVYPRPAHLEGIMDGIKKIAGQRLMQAKEEDRIRVANEEAARQLQKQNEREEAIKTQQQESELEAKNRVAEFRKVNTDYATTKKNYNARPVREVIGKMAESGVVPKPGELREFISDAAQSYQKSTYSERQRLGDDFTALLLKADPEAIKGDKGTFDLLNKLANDPEYPKPKALKEWIDRNLKVDVPNTPKEQARAPPNIKSDTRALTLDPALLLRKRIRLDEKKSQNSLIVQKDAPTLSIESKLLTIASNDKTALDEVSVVREIETYLNKNAREYSQTGINKRNYFFRFYLDYLGVDNHTQTAKGRSLMRSLNDNKVFQVELKKFFEQDQDTQRLNGPKNDKFTAEEKDENYERIYQSIRDMRRDHSTIDKNTTTLGYTPIKEMQRRFTETPEFLKKSVIAAQDQKIFRTLESWENLEPLILGRGFSVGTDQKFGRGGYFTKKGKYDEWMDKGMVIALELDPRTRVMDLNRLSDEEILKLQALLGVDRQGLNLKLAERFGIGAVIPKSKEDYVVVTDESAYLRMPLYFDELATYQVTNILDPMTTKLMNDNAPSYDDTRTYLELWLTTARADLATHDIPNGSRWRHPDDPLEPGSKPAHLGVISARKSGKESLVFDKIFRDYDKNQMLVHETLFARRSTDLLNSQDSLVFQQIVAAIKKSPARQLWVNQIKETAAHSGTSNSKEIERIFLRAIEG